MGSFSIWHWLIVLAVVLILFGGGGKISKLMGDFGKGLKSFKKGLAEDEPQPGQPATAIKSDAMGPSQPHDAAVQPGPRTDQPVRS